ncbi:hypothetical protein PFWH6_4465, partial [Pseudomonas fluorescens WH6]
FLTVGHGDLDHRKTVFLAGFFGEGPFGLEPRLFSLLDQKADLHFFSRYNATERHRQCQGTECLLEPVFAKHGAPLLVIERFKD